MRPALRAVILARRSAFQRTDVELPVDGDAPFDYSIFASVPPGNKVTITLPVGFPVKLRYTPEA